MLLQHILTVLIWHGIIFIILIKEGLKLPSLFLSFIAGSFMFMLVVIMPLLDTFIIALPFTITNAKAWQAFISSALNEELARAFVVFIFIKATFITLTPKEKLLMAIAIGTVFATIEHTGYISAVSVPILFIRLLVVSPLHMGLSVLHFMPKRGFVYAWLIHGLFNNGITHGYPWAQLVQMLAGISLIPLYFVIKMYDKPEEKFNIW